MPSQPKGVTIGNTTFNPNTSFTNASGQSINPAAVAAAQQLLGLSPTSTGSSHVQTPTLPGVAGAVNPNGTPQINPYTGWSGGGLAEAIRAGGPILNSFIDQSYNNSGYVSPNNNPSLADTIRNGGAVAIHPVTGQPVNVPGAGFSVGSNGQLIQNTAFAHPQPTGNPNENPGLTLNNPFAAPGLNPFGIGLGYDPNDPYGFGNASQWSFNNGSWSNTPQGINSSPLSRGSQTLNRTFADRSAIPPAPTFQPISNMMGRSQIGTGAYKPTPNITNTYQNPYATGGTASLSGGTRPGTNFGTGRGNTNPFQPKVASGTSGGQFGQMGSYGQFNQFNPTNFGKQYPTQNYGR